LIRPVDAHRRHRPMLPSRNDQDSDRFGEGGVWVAVPVAGKMERWAAKGGGDRWVMRGTSTPDRGDWGRNRPTLAGTLPTSLVTQSHGIGLPSDTERSQPTDAKRPPSPHYLSEGGTEPLDLVTSRCDRDQTERHQEDLSRTKDDDSESAWVCVVPPDTGWSGSSVIADLWTTTGSSGRNRQARAQFLLSIRVQGRRFKSGARYEPVQKTLEPVERFVVAAGLRRVA